MKRTGLPLRCRALVPAALCILTLTAQAEVPIYGDNIVGCHRIPLATNYNNSIALPLAKIPVAWGIVTSNDATSLTDDDAAWTPGEFAEGVSGAEPTGKSTFYVEIAEPEHAFEGRYFYIQTNSGSRLTLKGGLPADIAPDDLAGAAYKIVPSTRIRDAFGEPGGQVRLKGGSDPTKADYILFWSGNGWKESIYYKTTGVPSSRRGHWNWGTSFADDVVIDRDAGFFVNRKPGTPTNITSCGEVSANAQTLVLAPGNNLVGGGWLLDEPIGQTDLDTVLAGGLVATNTDRILEWGGSTWLPGVYYKTGGVPSSAIGHWTRDTNIVDQTFYLRAAEAYFFSLLTNRIWTRPSVLADR